MQSLSHIHTHGLHDTYETFVISHLVNQVIKINFRVFQKMKRDVISVQLCTKKYTHIQNGCKIINQNLVYSPKENSMIWFACWLFGNCLDDWRDTKICSKSLVKRTQKQNWNSKKLKRKKAESDRFLDEFHLTTNLVSLTSSQKKMIVAPL